MSYSDDQRVRAEIAARIAAGALVAPFTFDAKEIAKRAVAVADEILRQVEATRPR